MSELTIYPDNAPDNPQRFTGFEDIRRELDAIGIRFERWDAGKPVAPDASQEDILEAYREDMDRLMRENGFKTADVVSLTPDHPQREALRAKFLDEHTHSEDEVRFFVDGQGLFYIHKDDKVYAVLCEKGDLISVPDNTTHWFDMGPEPRFTAIRLFSNPEGWVANFTGSDIASRFPSFGE
ncbi:cupin [Thioalkalivibrio denitrificans]|uniref:Acireductone dioxygenase n=1 Tax=Thioalkalivibrio denitrificans TaxID=108003 RepID=A0A1V3NCK8_9GAMM|nr:acireductone dioxygenase [Thioalkalivibrio denitrificans]OOG22839.1 cupin [Thioalkalivibrio denitrificans]